MIFLTLSLLFVFSVWFFRHDTRQWRAKHVKSAGDRVGYWLLNLIAPLAMPYLVGFRILRRLDKPFTEDAKLNIEEYKGKKFKKCNDEDEDTMTLAVGPYMLGLIPIAAIVVGTILGTPYLEAHAPAVTKWVGETLMQVGR